MLLDGVLVQTAVASAATMGAPKLSGHDLLRHQMFWEASHVAKGRGWSDLRPAGNAIDLGLGGDIKTWYWGLDAPEPFEVEGVKVNRVAYLSVVVDDVVLTLTAPLRAEDDPDRAARVMSRAIRSLRRSEFAHRHVRAPGRGAGGQAGPGVLRARRAVLNGRHITGWAAKRSGHPGTIPSGRFLVGVEGIEPSASTV